MECGYLYRSKSYESAQKEGIDKKELGREGFLERTWQWKEEYAEQSRISLRSSVFPATGTEIYDPRLIFIC